MRGGGGSAIDPQLRAAITEPVGSGRCTCTCLLPTPWLCAFALCGALQHATCMSSELPTRARSRTWLARCRSVTLQFCSQRSDGWMVMKVRSTQLREASAGNRVAAAATARRAGLAALGSSRRRDRASEKRRRALCSTVFGGLRACSDAATRRCAGARPVELQRYSHLVRSQNRRLMQSAAQCVIVLSGNSTFRAVYATCSTTICKETTAWQRRSRAAT